MGDSENRSCRRDPLYSDEVKQSDVGNLDPASERQEDQVLNQEMPLMCEVRLGDREAFTELCGRYAIILRAYFNYHLHCQATIDDLSQTVLNRVWDKRANYRPNTPDLKYLKGYASYVLREYHKEVRSKPQAGPDILLETVIDISQPSPHEYAETKDEVRVLLALVDRLPEKQKQALTLTYL